MNNRLLPKDRGLIKGAVRRAFARSELRKRVLLAAKVDHKDESRPRVKTWYECAGCQGRFAQHQLEVDHKDPVIPTDSALEFMSWDEVVNRTWCEEKGLQVLCETCHDSKSKVEREKRKEHKKWVKNQSLKR